MKKIPIILSFVLAAGFMTACDDGSKAAEEAAKKEVAKLDSVSTQIDSTIEDLHSKKEELNAEVDNLMDELGIEEETAE